MKGKVFIVLAGVASLHLAALVAVSITAGGCKSSSKEVEPTQLPGTPMAPLPPAAPAQQPIAPPFNPDLTAAPSSSKSISGVPPFNPGAGKKEHSAVNVSGKYTVNNGDSLWKIAKNHGVSIKSLADANGISTTTGLKVGQSLNIPAGGKAPVAEKSAASTAPKQKKETAASKSSAESEKTPKKHTTAAPSSDALNSSTYSVKAGDTLAKIAAKHHIKTEVLAKANSITDIKKSLTVGQKLVIPKSSTSVSSSANVKKPEEKKTAAKPDDKKPTEAKPAAPAEPKDPDALGASGEKPPTNGTEDELDALMKGTSVPAPAASVVPAASDKDSKKTPAKADDKKAPATKTDDAAAPAPKASTHEPIEIQEETDIRTFAAEYGVKVDDLKKANPAIPSTGKLLPGMTVVLP